MLHSPLMRQRGKAPRRSWHVVPEAADHGIIVLPDIPFATDPAGAASGYTDIAYGAGLVVAVGRAVISGGGARNAWAAASTDGGITWTATGALWETYVGAWKSIVAHDGTQFACLWQDHLTGTMMATSPDGLVWSGAAVLSSAYIGAIHAPDKELIRCAVTDAGTILAIPTAHIDEPIAFLRVASGAGSWIDTGITASVYTAWKSICHAGGTTLVVGAGGNCLRSTDDGATWSPVSGFPATETLSDVAYGDGRWVVTGMQSSSIWVSTDDGVTFVEIGAPRSGNRSLCYDSRLAAFSITSTVSSYRYAKDVTDDGEGGVSVAWTFAPFVPTPASLMWRKTIHTGERYLILPDISGEPAPLAESVLLTSQFGDVFAQFTGVGTEVDPWVGMQAAMAAWAENIQPGDTVYLRGTHRQPLVVPRGGAQGVYLSIRGDYPGEPCVLMPGVIDTWDGPDAFGEYRSSWPSGDTIEGYTVATPFVVVTEDGRRLPGTSPTSSQRPKLTGYSLANHEVHFDAHHARKPIKTGDSVVFGVNSTPPQPLEKFVRYWAIAASTGYKQSAVKRCRLAASLADAMAGVHIPLTDDPEGGYSDLPSNWAMLEQYGFDSGRLNDYVPESLAPGSYAVDLPNRCLVYKPSTGVPADHVITCSTGTNLLLSGVNFIVLRGIESYGAVQAIDIIGGSNVKCVGNHVHDSTFGIRNNGGTRVSYVANKVKRIARHALGSVGVTNAAQEAYQHFMYNFIAHTAKLNDFLDGQSMVTNPDCDHAVFAHNLCLDEGNGLAMTNHGICVFDSSINQVAYGNVIVSCFGDIFELAGGDASIHTVDIHNNYIFDHSPGVTMFAGGQTAGKALGNNMAAHANTIVIDDVRFHHNYVYDSSFGAEVETSNTIMGALYALRTVHLTSTVIDVHIHDNTVSNVGVGYLTALQYINDACPEFGLAMYDNHYHGALGYGALHQRGAVKAKWDTEHYIGDAAGYFSHDTGLETGSTYSAQALPTPDWRDLVHPLVPYDAN